VREIHRIAQEQVCAEALQALVPGWMGTNGDAALRARLLQAWRRFGWRSLQEEAGCTTRAVGPGRGGIVTSLQSPQVPTPKLLASGMMSAACGRTPAQAGAPLAAERRAMRWVFGFQERIRIFKGSRST
jgi:hypothetical protein